VVTTATDLPFRSYILGPWGTAAGQPGDYYVYGREHAWTKVVLNDLKAGRHVVPSHGPLLEADILSGVGVASMEEVTPEKLRLFQQSADLSQGGIVVAGLNLDVGFAFAGVGILLGAAVFLMLGPLIALQNSGSPPELSTWTMAMPTTGRPLLEGAVASVWIFWVLMPIGIVVTQLLVRAPLPYAYEPIRWVGFLGLVLALWVHTRCALILRGIRHARTAPIAVQSDA